MSSPPDGKRNKKIVFKARNHIQRPQPLNTEGSLNLQGKLKLDCDERDSNTQKRYPPSVSKALSPANDRQISGTGQPSAAASSRYGGSKLKDSKSRTMKNELRKETQKVSEGLRELIQSVDSMHIKEHPSDVGNDHSVKMRASDLPQIKVQRPKLDVEPGRASAQFPSPINKTFDNSVKSPRKIFQDPHSAMMKQSRNSKITNSVECNGSQVGPLPMIDSARQTNLVTPNIHANTTKLLSDKPIVTQLKD